MPPRLFPLLWATLALLAGLGLAVLPLDLAVVLLLGTGLGLAAIWEPAVGLSLAAGLGPLKAFLAVAYPSWPSDVGQVFFALAVTGWVARGLLTRQFRVPRAPFLWLFAPFLAVAALSLLNAPNFEEGLKELLKWLQIVAGAGLAITELQRGRLGVLLGGLLLAGLAQAGVGLWQYAWLTDGPAHFRILGDHYRAYGSFEQPNPYGGYLGLLWPLFAGLGLEALRQLLERLQTAFFNPTKSPRATRFTLHALSPLLFFIPALGLLLALYISFSRGAWLGAAAAAAVLLLAWPKRSWVGFGLAGAGLLVVGALTFLGWLPASLTDRLASVADFTNVQDARGLNITPENFALVERLAHWQAAAEMARAQPWLGVGLGNYGTAYAQYQLLNWPNALGHAHMIYLNVLAETGGLGLLAYGLLWGGVIALTMRATRHTLGWSRGLALGLLGAWAHLTTHHLVDNLYVNNLHFTLAVLLGLLWQCGPSFSHDFFSNQTVRLRPQPPARAETLC